MQSFILRTAVILALAPALTGCAALGVGGMKASSARYRHAVRQGRLSGKGLQLYRIDADDFSKGNSFAAIRDTEAPSDGAQIFQDQVLTDVTTAKTVDSLGIPAAIGLTTSSAGQMQRFIMFYKTPPRSVVLKRSSMDVEWLTLTELYKSRIAADIPCVPRSVRRLVFDEGPIPPPWPVTITSGMREEFAVPARPVPPLTDAEGSDYAVVADDLAARLPRSRNAANVQRSGDALAKLCPVSHAGGMKWRINVFCASGQMGFGVPDGSLFVSDGLVQTLDDNELTAVVAHLMGHEMYQHGRSCANRHDIVAVMLLAGGALQMAGGGVGLFVIPSGGYLAVISDPEFGYTREYEIEANHAAALMLSDAGVPPDYLFDALLKLAGNNPSSTLAFDNLHRLPASIIDYGLLLDADLFAAEDE